MKREVEIGMDSSISEAERDAVVRLIMDNPHVMRLVVRLVMKATSSDDAMEHAGAVMCRVTSLLVKMNEQLQLNEIESVRSLMLDIRRCTPRQMWRQDCNHPEHTQEKVEALVKEAQ